MMSCKTGKTVYTSFSDAEKNIRIIRSYKRSGSRLTIRRNQKNIKPLKSYKCPECGGWHLTSQKT